MLTQVAIAKKLTASSATAWEAVRRIGRLESFDGRAIVVWTVDFESEPEQADTVAATLRAGIGAGVDGMERDLAAGADPR